MLSASGGLPRPIDRGQPRGKPGSARIARHLFCVALELEQNIPSRLCIGGPFFPGHATERRCEAIGTGNGTPGIKIDAELTECRGSPAKLIDNWHETPPRCPPSKFNIESTTSAAFFQGIAELCGVRVRAASFSGKAIAISALGRPRLEHRRNTDPIQLVLSRPERKSHAKARRRKELVHAFRHSRALRSSFVVLPLRRCVSFSSLRRLSCNPVRLGGVTPISCSRRVCVHCESPHALPL